MKILFDQGTPVPLRRHLHPHTVDTAAELGWAELENGDLIQAAEKAGYELLITTDQNLKYQQNLTDRIVAIIVLLNPSWPKLKLRIDQVVLEISDTASGEYREI